MSVDINAVACRVEQIHLGYTRYLNICADTHVDVPWVASDWFVFSLVSGIVLVGLSIITWVVFDVLRETRR